MSLAGMIYVAGIADSIKTFFFFWGFIFLLVWVIGFAIYYISAFFPNDEDAVTFRKITKPFIRGFVIAGFSSWIFAAIVPDSRTIYLIAGVQAAETVVANPEAQEIFGMVKDKLKSILAVSDTTTTKGK